MTHARRAFTRMAGHTREGKMSCFIELSVCSQFRKDEDELLKEILEEEDKDDYDEEERGH